MVEQIYYSINEEKGTSCLKRAREQGIFVSSSLLVIAHLYNYDRLRGGISTLWILSNQRSFGKPSSSWTKASNQFLLCLRPHLEYACPVWDPHLVKDRKFLENVQKFGCKLAAHQWDSGYQDLLDLFELPSLEQQRLHLKLGLKF